MTQTARPNYWLDRHSTRRRFLSTSAGAGAGMAALGIVGCGDDDDASAGGTTPASTAATNQATATPQQGGTYRSIGSGEPPHLDPSLVASTINNVPGAPFYSLLLRRDPAKLPDKIELTGDLAEAWQQPEPTKLVFTLRTGVQWHNGQPLTTKDVVTTFKTHSSGVFKGLFKTVTSISAPDDKTVVFNFSEPRNYFLNLLAASFLPVQPDAILTTNRDSLKTQPMGTGPYRLKSWDKNVKITYERNPNYFFKGQPYLDGIEYNTVAPGNPQLPVDLLRTHQIDISSFLFSPSKDQVDQIKSSVSGVKSGKWSSPATFGWLMNNKKPPFNDKRVRQAVSNIVDQGQTNDLTYNGNGSKGSYVIGGGAALPESELSKLIPGYRGITDNDIKNAKQLLSAAGLTGQISWDFLLAQTTLESNIAVYQDQFAKAGIKITPKMVDSTTELYPRSQSHDYTFMYIPWVFSFMDPGAYLQPFVSGDADNRPDFSNPTFDQKFGAFVKELDTSKEASASQELQRLLIDENAWTVAFVAGYTGMWWPNVQGTAGRKQNVFDNLDLFGVWMTKA